MQASATTWLNPPAGLMLSEKLPVCPAVTLADAFVAETEKSAPTPNRNILCGLPNALSLMVTAAVLLFPAVGVKATLIAQLAWTSSELPHVFDWVKSAPLVPVTMIPVMLSGVLPLLLSVAPCEPLLVPTT